MSARLFLLAIALGCAGSVGAQPVAKPAPTASPPLSSAAESVYEAARSKLVQIRTLVASAGRQASIGSAFVVRADGLAITNYHVISQYALEPSTYRLEYIGPDGQRGALQLLGIDIANDLALVRLEGPARNFFEFDSKALRGSLPKGEHLYSMGNPLDLGFTIVEGTYNGLVERSFNERIHFTGAVNPGMSGGPTVTAAGRVVGINVAKRFGAELVSFLVPARYAARLIEQAGGNTFSPDGARTEITRQLHEWQAGFYAAIESKGLRDAVLGPYRAAESEAPWFTCWARTNIDQVPAPRASLASTNCKTETGLFVANDLRTGVINIEHAYSKSTNLNRFQFASFVSKQYYPSWIGGGSRKRLTRQQCHEETLAGGDGRPPLRAVWCARAYREFEGLYDVSLLVVTQDSGNEAVVSRLTMQGFAYGNAVEFAKRFIRAVRRNP